MRISDLSSAFDDKIIIETWTKVKPFLTVQ